MPRLALVTGACSGLGLALCRLLASKNIPLFITARDPKKLSALAQEVQPQITYVADLGDRKSRHGLVETIQHHAPDLIINNAGFGLYGDALLHTTFEQLEILEVNGSALLEITLEGARALKQKKKRGTILNVSSAAAFFTYPTFSVYAASKAFVNQFSQAFDAEMSPYGIRILTVCPGQIDTSFRERASKGHPQKSDAFTMKVEDVAEMIWNQIEKGKSLSVIDWRYRLATALGRFCVPKGIVRWAARRAISERFSQGT